MESWAIIELIKCKQFIADLQAADGDPFKIGLNNPRFRGTTDKAVGVNYAFDVDARLIIGPSQQNRAAAEEWFEVMFRLAQRRPDLVGYRTFAAEVWHRSFEGVAHFGLPRCTHA